MEERAVIAKSFPQWKVLVVALGLIPFNRVRQNVIVTTAKTSPGGLGHLLNRYYPPCGIKKPGGSGDLLDW